MHTILFLAANPLGADRRALDREARAIQVELERSGDRDRFELTTRWAVEPLDLLRELRALQPTVVHFSGRGGIGEPGGRATEHGLVFQGPDGRARRVSAAALTRTFGAAGPSVQIVVLSACYSEVQAAALVAQVDCVVGMAGSIDDATARSFAIGFYGGLGAGESVATAYRQGAAAIHLEGLSAPERPRLEVRAGVDANHLVLAARSSQRPYVRSAPSISASHGSVAAGSITHSVVNVGALPGRDHDDE
jgi:hypothetical protein